MQRQDGRWSLWGCDAGTHPGEEAPRPLGAFDAVVMCDAMTANRGACLPLDPDPGLELMQLKTLRPICTSSLLARSISIDGNLKTSLDGVTEPERAPSDQCFITLHYYQGPAHWALRIDLI